jgi:hypothetical protein
MAYHILLESPMLSHRIFRPRQLAYDDHIIRYILAGHLYLFLCPWTLNPCANINGLGPKYQYSSQQELRLSYAAGTPVGKRPLETLDRVWPQPRKTCKQNDLSASEPPDAPQACYLNVLAWAVFLERMSIQVHHAPLMCLCLLPLLIQSGITAEPLLVIEESRPETTCAKSFTVHRCCRSRLCVNFHSDFIGSGLGGGLMFRGPLSRTGGRRGAS